jgi:hypothetical protein
MSELKEHLQNVSNDLLVLAELRKDLDVLSKDFLLTMILTATPDIKVSDLIETLKAKAADIREEQEKLEGLVETMAMEGPNQFKSVYYRPTCKFGWDDCIYDPAYIYSTYPDWYKSLYGDMTPEEAASKFKKSCCFNCTNGDLYDDEDK